MSEGEGEGVAREAGREGVSVLSLPLHLLRLATGCDASDAPRILVNFRRQKASPVTDLEGNGLDQILVVQSSESSTR